MPPRALRDDDCMYLLQDVYAFVFPTAVLLVHATDSGLLVLGHHRAMTRVFKTRVQQSSEVHPWANQRTLFAYLATHVAVEALLKNGSTRAFIGGPSKFAPGLVRLSCKLLQQDAGISCCLGVPAGVGELR